MALLAAYMGADTDRSLGVWLRDDVFATMDTLRLEPDATGMAGYTAYMQRYTTGLDGVHGLKEVQ